MFKDQRMQLALIMFGVFLVMWSVMDLGLGIPDSNALKQFVMSGTGGALGAILLFLKAEGGMSPQMEALIDAMVKKQNPTKEE